MSGVEVFLDETPGETRGIVVRDGRFERLLIQRDDDIPAHRLGARSIGRVLRVEPGLKAAFVDLGVEGPAGFMPLKGGAAALTRGACMEVEITAEPRDDKGPVLRLVGPGQGEPRLLEAGPDVSGLLASLGPGSAVRTGAEAIQAGLDSEEEALAGRLVLNDLGLDLNIQRTRALVAVDLDWSAISVAHGRQARDRANARGLAEAARLMRLKGWGGLVAVDLIGTGHNGETVQAWARKAFAASPDVALGPVNRFGVLMASAPWGTRPIETILHDASGRPSLRTRAQAAVRILRRALLDDTASAGITVRCTPDEATLASPLIAALGPRAGIVADRAIAPGAPVVEGR